MHIDPTINIGHLTIVGSIAISVAAGWATYKVTISDHEYRIGRIEDTIKNSLNSNSEFSTALNAIKQDIAVIRYRMDQVDRVPSK